MFGPDLFYLSGFVRLSVPDVEAAAVWYSDALGFTAVTAKLDASTPWQHLRRGDGQDLVLVSTAGRGRVRARSLLTLAAARVGLPPLGPVVCLAVDRAPAVVAAEARRHGARIKATDEAVTVIDPFGNSWVLFSRLPATGASARRSAPAPRANALARRRARNRVWRTRP